MPQEEAMLVQEQEPVPLKAALLVLQEPELLPVPEQESGYFEAQQPVSAPQEPSSVLQALERETVFQAVP